MVLSRMLASPDATERFGEALAPHLRGGDTIALSGELGAGKSLLARAIITTRLEALGRPEEVPSPTFTLVQTYDLGECEAWHADLYRLSGPGEVIELGLEDAFDTTICLVEWPEKLGSLLPERRLDVRLSEVPDDEAARWLTLEARGDGWQWLSELDRGAP